jgi:hypothetical protein
MAAAKISGVLMIIFPSLCPISIRRQRLSDSWRKSFVTERRDEKGRRTHPSSCGLSGKFETFSERAVPAPVMMMIPEFHRQVESRRSVPRKEHEKLLR